MWLGIRMFGWWWQMANNAGSLQIVCAWLFECWMGLAFKRFVQCKYFSYSRAYPTDAINKWLNTVHTGPKNPKNIIIIIIATIKLKIQRPERLEPTISPEYINLQVNIFWIKNDCELWADIHWYGIIFLKWGSYALHLSF